MSLVLNRSRPAGGGRTLCVLGAGNCNDLDLVQLLGAFARIDLVDLDECALQGGIVRQGLSGEARLRCIGNTDVTGLLEMLAYVSNGHRRTTQEYSPAFARIGGSAAGYDVVMSTCLLSQLVASVVHALGETHSEFMTWVLCVRQQHIELLMNLTRPGGVALLVNDFVSSDSVPTLLGAMNDDLISLMGEVLDTGNFFHGCSPFAIAQACRTNFAISSRIRSLQVTSPWRWDLGPERSALVCAVILASHPHNGRIRNEASFLQSL